MSRLVVLHRGYGCETGCCGHVVELDGRLIGSFEFSHCDNREEARKFAEDLVREQYGENYVADLDWEHCVIFDYNDEKVTP